MAKYLLLRLFEKKRYAHIHACIHITSQTACIECLQTQTHTHTRTRIRTCRYQGANLYTAAMGSFYKLSAESHDGKMINFEQHYAGKVSLVINVASSWCVYIVCIVSFAGGSNLRTRLKVNRFV